jgi:hypothetical protein
VFDTLALFSRRGLACGPQPVVWEKARTKGEEKDGQKGGVQES